MRLYIDEPLQDFDEEAFDHVDATLEYSNTSKKGVSP